jgi:hypothetical protein
VAVKSRKTIDLMAIPWGQILNLESTPDAPPPRILSRLSRGRILNLESSPARTSAVRRRP